MEDNPLKNTELFVYQNYNHIDGLINNLPALTPETEKPLDKVKEPPSRRRSRVRESNERVSDRLQGVTLEIKALRHISDFERVKRTFGPQEVEQGGGGRYTAGTGGESQSPALFQPG